MLHSDNNFHKYTKNIFSTKYLGQRIINKELHKLCFSIKQHPSEECLNTFPRGNKFDTGSNPLPKKLYNKS